MTQADNQGRYLRILRLAVAISLVISAPALAAQCQTLRGYAGMEAGTMRTSGSLWSLQSPAFRNNQLLNAYASAGGSCTLGSQLSARAQMGAQYAAQSHQPGSLEGKRREGLALLNEGYVTWTARDNLFIDLGKIRKSSGYLFSVAPLDLLRNTAGNMRSVKVNALGTRWRNFYDEGSVGASATLYRDNGTFEVAALPRLARHDKRQETAADWSMLERTNATDRYYASYTATGLARFNPSVALLTGDYRAVAAGMSGYLTDNLILNLETSLGKGQRWRHLDAGAARQIQNYQRVDEPFRQNKSGYSADVGAGLRYTDSSLTEYGLEYYGQSQGYSRSEWETFFDTAKFVNGGYAAVYPPGITPPPPVSEGYRQYSRLMAAETDNVGRAGNLQGKHYLTAYISTNKDELKKVDWMLSGVVNLVDQSSVLNLHLNTHFTENVEGYVGSSYSVGSERSEFGLFGEKGTVYAGMRIIW